MNNSPSQSTPRAPKHLHEMQQIRESLIDAEVKKPRVALWFGLLAVAVVLLIIGAVIQVLTPKNIEIPTTSFVFTNVNNTISKIGEVVFSGEKPEVPPQLPILRADHTISEADVITKITTRYGLLKDNPQNNFWINGPTVLLQDPSDKTLTLILKEPDNSTVPTVNITAAQDVANSYIQELFPELQLAPLSSADRYLNLSMETDQAESPEVATGVQFAYTPQIDSGSYPVFYEKTTRPPFTVTVDGQNIIRSLTFFPLFKQYINVGTLPPISLERALSQIREGKASIISATSVEAVVSMSGIKSAEFQSVDLQYREDPEAGLVYPFYHFVGTGTDQKNVTADIQVITPAIETLELSR